MLQKICASILLICLTGKVSFSTDNFPEPPYHAKKTNTPPVIDGLPIDTCWSLVDWAPIDQVWIGQPTTPDDYTGMFKVVWTPDRLYVLMKFIRKIVIDNYGPEIPIGGGSFAGKDYTKVDRSGAYVARKIAVDFIKSGRAKEVFIKLAYCIGKAEPVMAIAVLDGKEEKIEGYDLTPKGIKKLLNLENVKFAETSQWGNFGRGFNWDK